MRKYGESKTTRIMMATVPQVTSGSGFRKFQTDEFLFDRVYIRSIKVNVIRYRSLSYKVSLGVRALLNNFCKLADFVTK